MPNVHNDHNRPGDQAGSLTRPDCHSALQHLNVKENDWALDLRLEFGIYYSRNISLNGAEGSRIGTKFMKYRIFHDALIQLFPKSHEFICKLKYVCLN